MVAQDEGGGDDEDEALGQPEDGEDFQKEASHLGSASNGEGSAQDELVAGAADGFDAVGGGIVGG